MKKLLLALLFSAFIPAAQAQNTKAQMGTTIATDFADNTTGAITPAILRSFFTTQVASFQQYASVNAQTGTTYTFLIGDYGKLVTFSNGSAIAVALPVATSFTPWNVYVRNLGVGTVTITPTTSTINGAATLVLATGQAAWIVSDGTNYQTWINGTVVTLGGTATLTQDAVTNAVLSNTSTGTSAITQIVVSNSANSAAFGLPSTGYTGVTALQNFANINASSGTAGIHFYNAGDKPIVFSLNATERARFQPTGLSAANGVITLGLTGSLLGCLGQLGSTSGVALLCPQAAAGEPTLVIGTTSGTIAASATSPLAISATTGVITCATCAPNPGTSGGIPYYNSTTSMASSGLLAANGVVYGGGAGATPASTAAGTTGQVLIGGTPPSFSASPSLTTSLTAPALIGSTSVTSPLLIGGSGTTGTQQTFKTTTGNGTTDAFAFLGGNDGGTIFGNWNTTGLGIGTATQSVKLQVVNNATTVTPTAGTVLGVAGANASTTAISIDGYGGLPFFVFRRANGTAASPTAVASADIVGAFGVFGYNSSAYTTSASGSIFFNATETWTTTANGLNITFRTTPNGSTGAAVVERLKIDQDGAIFFNSIAASAQANALCYNSTTKVVTYNSGVTTCLASMASVKDLHAPIYPDEALRAVLAMRPWTYLDKIEQRERIGLVAEYVADIDERLVARDVNGALSGVRYEQYTAHLTGAIQALEQRVKQLELR